MTTKTTPSPTGAAHSDGGQLRLVDLAAVLLRRAGTILSVLLLVVVGTLAVLLLRPKSYSAAALLVPATQQGSSSASLAAAQFARDLPVPGLMKGQSSSEKLVDIILKSNALRAAVLQGVVAQPKFGGVQADEIATIIREDATAIHKEDGSIDVAVNAPDPELATAVANQYGVAINQVARRVGIDLGRRKQEFLTTQLADARDQLVQSEQRLLTFQRSRDAPDIQEQAKLTVGAAADLQRAIAEKEVQIAVLQRVATPDNPELRMATGELQALRSQLRRLTSGSQDGSIYLSLSESPNLQIEAARLLRDYKRDEQVFVSLTAALADAQIDINNDMPVLSVLDQAEVPTSPTPPPFALGMIVASVFGLLLGIGAALLREMVDGMRRGRESAVLSDAWGEFRAGMATLIPGGLRRADPR